MKIYSWNVNGLRSVLKKGALDELIKTHQPDILCLQETKAKPGQAEVDYPDYEEIWNSAERPGYSGTAVFSKIAPQQVFNGFTDEITAGYMWSDDQYGGPLNEGRVQTLEFEHFYLINVYTPNSKRDLSRLKLREQLWDPAMLRFLQDLEKHKPIVICGDFNAAHQPIDLARPKDNEHNAGYTVEERQGITNLIAGGFLDTFRTLHPEDQLFTWWSNWSKCRERNIGWRIDYFFISAQLLPHLKSAEIYNEVMGSDHCPISIELEF